jgi:hypothetical protein
MCQIVKRLAGRSSRAESMSSWACFHSKAQLRLIICQRSWLEYAGVAQPVEDNPAARTSNKQMAFMMTFLL